MGKYHFYDRSAAVTGRERHFTAAHHFKTLTDIRQRGMRLAVVGGLEVGAGVLYGDLAVFIYEAGPDVDMQRIAVRVEAVLDSVLHKGLQGQRGYTEAGMRRIVIDIQHILMLRLLHGEIGAGMLELLLEIHHILAGDCGEVLAQIGGEVQRDLLGFVRVLFTEVVDTHHRVIDEVRAHLQHHDAGVLVGDLTLLTKMLYDLIRHDDSVHRQRADTDA